MKNIALFLLIILTACAQRSERPIKDGEENMTKETKTATFAGGCFWCMEAALEENHGVIEVISGYTAGEKEYPTYKEVSSGTTGHFEAVQVTYDPNIISYEELLDLFWRQIDPTDSSGQFADRGSQYKTVIFYHDEEQKKLAEKSKSALENSGKFDKPIATQILPAEKFYKAEEYHQDYYKKQSAAYRSYKKGSGREDYIKKNWEE